MAFEENYSSSFFDTRTAINELQNLDFKEFFSSKRIIHSEKHAKKGLCIELEENLFRYTHCYKWFAKFGLQRIFQ